MTNILWTFEYRITQLQPDMLLAVGIVFCALGLFLWLGGLGFKKIMYTIAGAFFGAFCTLLITAANPLLGAALIGIFALLALKLQESFFMVVASAFAAALGFYLLIRPYYQSSNNLLLIMRQLAVDIPFYNWPILAAMIALPFAVISWPSTSAVFNSAAGAVMMLVGTIIFLLYSGFEVFGHLKTRTELYIEAFGAATILGSVIQTMLLPKISTRFAAVKGAKAKRTKVKKGDAGAVEKTVTWRTS